MVVRTEPLITPILTATAWRHALVAAGRAVVRGGGERGDTGAGATLGGSAGGVGSVWTWSGSPAVVRRARLQGWATLPRASSASSFCCRPLMTLFSDLVSPLAMSSSLCAGAATLAMRVISPLPVSTSRSRNWTLLRR